MSSLAISGAFPTSTCGAPSALLTSTHHRRVLPFNVVPLAPLPLYLVTQRSSSSRQRSTVGPRCTGTLSRTHSPVLVCGLGRLRGLHNGVPLSDYVDLRQVGPGRWAALTVVGLLRLSLENMHVGSRSRCSSSQQRSTPSSGIAIFNVSRTVQEAVQPLRPTGSSCDDAFTSTTRREWSSLARLGGIMGGAQRRRHRSWPRCAGGAGGLATMGVHALFVLTLVLTWPRRHRRDVVVGALLVFLFPRCDRLRGSPPRSVRSPGRRHRHLRRSCTSAVVLPMPVKTSTRRPRRDALATRCPAPLVLQVELGTARVPRRSRLQVAIRETPLLTICRDGIFAELALRCWC